MAEPREDKGFKDGLGPAHHPLPRYPANFSRGAIDRRDNEGNRRMKRFFPSIGFFTLLMFTTLPGAPAGAAELKMGGTGGDLGTLRLLADAYAAKHPDLKITVFPSLGSGGGIRAVAAGAIDLSISSRPLKEQERAAGLRDFAYGKTALVLASSGQHRELDLTLPDVVELYTHNQRSWLDGHVIRMILRPRNDGDTKLLEKQIDGMAAAFRTAEKRGATIGRSDQDAAQALEKRPDAVGFISLSLIMGENRPLNALPLNGVTPTVETLESGRYPLVKIFYMVMKDSTTAVARAFVAFLKSPVGGNILRQTGHIPAE